MDNVDEKFEINLSKDIYPELKNDYYITGKMGIMDDINLTITNNDTGDNAVIDNLEYEFEEGYELLHDGKFQEFIFKCKNCGIIE